MTSKGFLLFELTVALALIAGMLSCGIGAFGYWDRVLVRSQLQELAAVMETVQHRALMSGTQQDLVFEEHGYRADGVYYALPPQIKFGSVPGALGPPAQPHRPVTSPVTFIRRTMSCAPEGVLRAGTVYLTDHHQRYSYALSVPVGGYYRTLYEWDGTQWQQR